MSPNRTVTWRSAFPLLALTLLLACGSPDSNAGGNSMETENTVYGRILGRDGQASSGLTQLCANSLPLCASGTLASDSLDQDGYFQLPLPSTGTYQILVTTGTGTLTIPVTVQGNESSIDLGEWSTATQSPTSEQMTYWPDSGVVVLNPRDTALLSSPANAPATTTGQSLGFSLMGWNYPTALLRTTEGALLISHTQPQAYRQDTYLALTPLDGQGTLGSSKAYHVLGKYGKANLYNGTFAQAVLLPAGHIAIACAARMDSELNNQIWVAEFNAEQELLWARLYRDKKIHRSLAAIGTDAAGNLYISGSQGSSLTDSLQPFLLRLSAQGQWLGTHTYAPLGENRSTRIDDAGTDDAGNTLQILHVYSAALSAINAQIRRLAPDGSLISTTSLEKYNSALLAQDPGNPWRIVSNNSGTSTIALQTLTDDGSLAPQGSYALAFSLRDHQVLADGGTLTVAKSHDKVSDTPLRYTTQGTLLRSNASGDTLWTETLGDSASDEEYMTSTQLANGNLLIAGRTYIDSDHQPLWIRVRSSE